MCERGSAPSRLRGMDQRKRVAAGSGEGSKTTLRQSGARKRWTENGLSQCRKKFPISTLWVAAVGLQWDLANTNGIDKFFRRDVREGKEKLMPAGLQNAFWKL